ncbi:e9imm peptide [Streptomyces sp. WAC01280]|uniref:e9imm peptide n=1 Tax=Streptomyces sp. WAC01280 TaxID=2487424 RepID=UPI000F78684B|nr:e9imm peptide [Streptomyces sp. WAC01280]RSS53245.1 e9imm peptide [Streptomyces sp. WAC01280]
MSREEALPLVQRLLNPETTDEESSEILEALQRGLACPHISDYVYWDIDPEPTAEKIVDRAMTYKPIAL